MASSVPEGPGLLGPAGSRPLRTTPRSRGSSDSGELDPRPRPGVQAGLPGGLAPQVGRGTEVTGAACPSYNGPSRWLQEAPRAPTQRSRVEAQAGARAGAQPRSQLCPTLASTTPRSKEALAQRPGTPGGGTKGLGEPVPRAGPGPHVWASESSSRPPLPRRYLARSFRVTSPTTWLRLSTTTKCRRPSARNSLNTRGSDASCGTV